MLAYRKRLIYRSRCFLGSTHTGLVSSRIDVLHWPQETRCRKNMLPIWRRQPAAYQTPKAPNRRYRRKQRRLGSCTCHFSSKQERPLLNLSTGCRGLTDSPTSPPFPSRRRSRYEAGSPTTEDCNSFSTSSEAPWGNNQDGLLGFMMHNVKLTGCRRQSGGARC